MRKITLILFLIFLPVRKGRANLLEFPAGARARAMGYAYTSIADDGSAASWNPAGITGVSSPRIYFMHTPLWLDTFYNFISYHHPVKKLGTLGVSYCRIDSSGFVARSSLFEEPEEFSTAHQAFIISGAKQLAGKYHLGVNLKGVFSRIYETSAAGFGADIGFKYDINKAWDSGLTLKNIVPPVLKWNSENENYPLVLSLGSSYRYSRFLFSVNVKKKKNIPLRFGLGTEGEINRYLDLRAGWQDYPGIGLGVNWRQFTLNYSFLFHELGYNHTFDFTWRPAWIPGAGQMEKFSKRMAKKRADKYWEKGIEYYKQQKYEMALVEWEKALIWQPGNEKIQKRVSEVNKQLDVIVNRRLLEQHLTSAYKLYSSGKLKESLEEWQEVLVFDPGNSRAREYIEKIKDKLGEKEREKAEREMLLKRQARINTLINRGEKFLEKNRISEAIRKFEEVFKYEPENSKAAELIAGAKKQRNKLFDKYHSRALEHRSRKEYRKAIKYFRKALDFKDSSRVRAALKEVREKIKETTPQVSQAMVDKLYYTAADHYFNQRYEKAMSLINKILKFRPGDENTLKLKEKISATMELSNR